MNNKILEGNKLISKFMGYPFYEEHCHKFYGGPIEGETIYLGNIILKSKPDIYCDIDGKNIRNTDFLEVNDKWYNNLWDWLIPAMEKYEDEGLHLQYCLGEIICSCDGKDKLFYAPYDDKQSNIERFWLAIIEFIKFYNKNNHGTNI